ncbi:NAD-dependent epimerase/dehydratase family protein [Fodinicola acaciae]|uniref:NAD-dependent epimerase/dehydratase family protein n=1 Tax=Fodinicola acaciae TaxID=2681555 RepID=UPI0013D754CD|nr:NAD-dependent epimerase/dehydratase family protein [Fodinicola acaciae]
MRIAVTGGAGFLGRAVLTDLRAYGHDADAFSRRTHTDVRNAGEVGKLGAYDAIVHLAAPTSGHQSFADPLTFFDVIVGGTRNVLAAATNQKIVYASTNAIYGSAHDGQLTEDLPPHPESPYAAAKLAGEQLVGTYGNAAVLRIFNVAGGRDTDLSRILPRVLAATTGQPLMVNGDGTAVRDFVHVTDVAAAVRLALTHTGTYNIGSGHGTSILDLVRTAEKVTGRRIEVCHRPAKPEPHSLIADIGKAARELGWRPEHSDLETIVRDATR